MTPTRHAYGSDPSQFGELYRPVRSEHRGTVVIIHGGFWLSAYNLSLGAPLAADLVGRGYTVWNIEYRRVGDGGGWPTTLDDVSAAIDHLSALDVDTSALVGVGHSAGGQLAVWAAGPHGPKLRMTGVVSQAGVLAMRTAALTGVGGTAEADFLGGTPAQVPDRYRLVDPIEQVPITPPVLCVHSQADQNVPYSQSVDYVAAATKAGGHALLHETQGDHFTLIDPTSAAWTYVRNALPGLLGGRLPNS